VRRGFPAGCVLDGASMNLWPLAVLIWFPLFWPVAAIVRVPFWWYWLSHEESEELPACQRCGYCLTGNTSGVCPECGTKVQSEPDVAAR
jgi:hypothetical protein